MIVLKQVIHYPETNSVESTWVDRTQAPDIQVAEVPEVPEVLEVLEVPEQQATYDEAGVELTPYIAPVTYVAPVAYVPAVPAHTVPGEITEVQVKCHSYAACQMDMLAADLGPEDAALHADLLEAVTASYLPPEPEPISIPQVISMRQARLALLEAGLLDDVDSALLKAPRTYQIEWEFATEVNRSWPTITAIQSLLDMTDFEIDNLFLLASTK